MMLVLGRQTNQWQQATMRVTMLSINAAKMRTLSNCQGRHAEPPTQRTNVVAPKRGLCIPIGKDHLTPNG